MTLFLSTGIILGGLVGFILDNIMPGEIQLHQIYNDFVFEYKDMSMYKMKFHITSHYSKYYAITIIYMLFLSSHIMTAHDKTLNKNMSDSF